MKSSSSMPRTLTRETFISPDHAKIAATQAAMYNVTADGVEEVPVPASVRESGSIPDGYTVDFVLDPATLVRAFKDQDIITEEQLPAGVMEGVTKIINDPENLRIIPKELHTKKREAERQVLGE